MTTRSAHRVQRAVAAIHDALEAEGYQSIDQIKAALATVAGAPAYAAAVAAYAAVHGHYPHERGAQ